MSAATEPDPLTSLCVAMLHEIGGYAITKPRIEQALPLMRELLAEIRRLDEVELGFVEPAVVFIQR